MADLVAGVRGIEDYQGGCGCMPAATVLTDAATERSARGGAVRRAVGHAASQPP